MWTGAGHLGLPSWGTLLLAVSKQAAEPSPETQGQGTPQKGAQEHHLGLVGICAQWRGHPGPTAGPLSTSSTHTGRVPPEPRGPIPSGCFAAEGLTCPSS